LRGIPCVFRANFATNKRIELSNIFMKRIAVPSRLRGAFALHRIGISRRLSSFQPRGCCLAYYCLNKWKTRLNNGKCHRFCVFYPNDVAIADCRRVARCRVVNKRPIRSRLTNVWIIPLQITARFGSESRLCVHAFKQTVISDNVASSWDAARKRDNVPLRRSRGLRINP